MLRGRPGDLRLTFAEVSVLFWKVYGGWARV